MSSDTPNAGTQNASRPKAAVVGTLALLCATATVIGAARFGTPYEFGISLAALAVVVIGLWRCVR